MLRPPAAWRGRRGGHCLTIVLVVALTIDAGGAYESDSEAEKLIAGLSRAEKAQVLQWLVRDLGDAFPGIESREGVIGGTTCIARTRIPVWLLEQARRLGTNEADLLRSYPALMAQDLANAWAYVRSHRKEVEREIAEQERDDD